jgi:hypothetical protein
VNSPKKREREIVRIKIATAWPISLIHRRDLFEDVKETIVILLSCLPLNIQEQIGKRSLMVFNDLENMV